MKNIMQKYILSFGVIAAFVVSSLAIVSPVSALDPLSGACQGAAAGNSNLCKNSGSTVDGLIRNVVRLLIWAIGVISVIVIIISGIKYVTSDGDASKIKSAKDTILYAVVGLVVAILAYAIVEFVLGSIT
jgi:hypothetical protein